MDGLEFVYYFFLVSAFRAFWTFAGESDLILTLIWVFPSDFGAGFFIAILNSLCFVRAAGLASYYTTAPPPPPIPRRLPAWRRMMCLMLSEGEARTHNPSLHLYSSLIPT